MKEHKPAVGYKQAEDLTERFNCNNKELNKRRF